MPTTKSLLHPTCQSKASTAPTASPHTVVKPARINHADADIRIIVHVHTRTLGHPPALSTPTLTNDIFYIRAGVCETLHTAMLMSNQVT